MKKNNNNKTLRLFFSSFPYKLDEMLYVDTYSFCVCVCVLTSSINKRMNVWCSSEINRTYHIFPTLEWFESAFWFTSCLSFSQRLYSFFHYYISTTHRVFPICWAICFEFLFNTKRVFQEKKQRKKKKQKIKRNSTLVINPLNLCAFLIFIFDSHKQQAVKNLLTPIKSEKWREIVNSGKLKTKNIRVIVYGNC